MAEPRGKHSPLSPFLALLLWSALLLLLSCMTPCVLAVAGRRDTHLPGFHGPLPFHLETGYVGVDDRDQVQLFYYFTPSERDPAEDPLLLWLTGGPGCSGLCGLAFEIDPISFLKSRYVGSLPNLVQRPDSWTKISNIIFLDSPVGTGFSYSTNPENYKVGDISLSRQVVTFLKKISNIIFLDSPVGAGFSYSTNPENYKVGDISSSRQVVTFLKKWLQDHPHFISNPLYIAGDSYAGKVVPIIAQLISEGIFGWKSSYRRKD